VVLLTVVLDSRHDIDLGAFRRVAVDGEPVRIGKRAIERMERARTSFMTLLESDRSAFIYGTTSGAGSQAKISIPPGEQRKAAKRMQEHESRGISFGGGFLPERVVRGIVLARLANFLDGHAKTRPVIAERIATMLDGRPLPRVPYDGQVGPGEILTLAHVVGGLPRGDMEEAEPMAVINGSPCSAALAADVALHAQNRAGNAARVFALSVEALGAPLDAYDEALDELWSDLHEAQALQALRGHLAGAPTYGRRHYQAPVSWRILPRVLASAYRAVDEIEEVATISLSSVTDNPVYVPPDDEHPLGRAFSTGGYHNAMAYPAMDALSAAWADLATLADRQTTKLHNGPVSELPHMLVRSGSDSWGTGGLALLQIGIGEEARRAAQRTLLPPSEGGGFGQNDVSSPTFVAYRKEQRAAWCLDASIAMLAVSASQALWVTDRAAPLALSGFVAGVRSVCPPIEEGDWERDVGAELERLTEIFQAGALSGNLAFDAP
jgi:histidine ammonia-lyase